MSTCLLDSPPSVWYFWVIISFPYFSRLCCAEYVPLSPPALPLTPSLHRDYSISSLLWVSPTARKPITPYLLWLLCKIALTRTLSGSPEFVLFPCGISLRSQPPAASQNLTLTVIRMLPAP